MTETGFIPAENSRELSKLACATTLAAGDLMRLMVDMLPAGRHDRFHSILERGGQVGVETTVDRNARRRLLLVAIDTDGTRFEAGEVLFVGDPPSARS